MQTATPYTKFDNPSTPARQLEGHDVTVNMQGAGQAMGAHGAMHHPQQMTVYEVPQKWGWGTLVLSVLSLCCCQIFGIIATISAITSYVDHKVKDYAGAQRKRSMARGFGIAAIVTGSLIILIVIIYFAIAMAAVTNAVSQLNEQYP